MPEIVELNKASKTELLYKPGEMCMGWRWRRRKRSFG